MRPGKRVQQVLSGWEGTWSAVRVHSSLHAATTLGCGGQRSPSNCLQPSTPVSVRWALRCVASSPHPAVPIHYPLATAVPMQVRTLIQREMGAALGRYDALLCPAAPTPAYKLGSKVSDPLAMYKGESAGCR